jgi:hypothetical protein
MGREIKAAHANLSRARTELHRRHLEAESFTAEYHKVVAAGGERVPPRISLSRAATSDGDSGKADTRVSAAADRLARLCQRLAVANARVAQAEEVYRRERAASFTSTWKYCTLNVPAVYVLERPHPRPISPHPRPIPHRLISPRLTSSLFIVSHPSPPIFGRCMQLKGVEARRAHELSACVWRALDQMGNLPAAHTNAVEELARQAAMVKGRRWLDATL